MAATAVPRATQEFADRPDALAGFLRSAGNAPRLMTLDDGAGCPLFNALAALQWTSKTGLVQPADRLHAVWFSAESAAAVIERTVGGESTFRYFGPRLEAPQKSPVEGKEVVDQLFVRGYEFGVRWNAIAHFLVTTQARGALITAFARRAPAVEHVQRWLFELFQGPVPAGADHLHAAWFATTGAGYLFPPASFANEKSRGWSYVELGAAREE